MLEEYGDIFDRKKSYTTRDVREGNEKAKENYYFISEPTFRQKMANKDFIEHRQVAEGVMYGTCVKEL